MQKIDFSALKVPFPAKDIEWRLQSCGKTKDGKVWGKVLAYVTNRAIQTRLDEVCGPNNWKNEFIAGPNGGILCGLSIRCDGEWITKWDGAENTQVEAVKGGLSDSMKRAAVQWSIGRYLYNLDEGWANICKDGCYSGKTKDGEMFKWNPPLLPSWALPYSENNNDKKTSASVNKSSPAPTQADDPETAKAIQTVQSYIASGKITKGLDKAKGYINEKNLEGLNKVIAFVKEQDGIEKAFDEGAN